MLSMGFSYVKMCRPKIENFFFFDFLKYFHINMFLIIKLRTPEKISIFQS